MPSLNRPSSWWIRATAPGASPGTALRSSSAEPGMGAHRHSILAHLRESCRVKESFSEDLLARIESFAERSAEALARGAKIVFFGNGGSAAGAPHRGAGLKV